MLKIDNTLLQDIGLGQLPDAEKNSLLKHVYETLEMRVGMRLADQMTNQQLDEFEQYFEAKDDAGAFQWLEANFPNYKDIVQEEFDKLKGEVAESAPQILAAAQVQAAMPAGSVPADPTLMPPPQPYQQPLPAQAPLPQPYQSADPVPAQPLAQYQPPAPTYQDQFAAPQANDAPVQDYTQPMQQPPQPYQPATQSTQPQYPYPPTMPSQQPPAGPGV
jgi:hypothetical protein